MRENASDDRITAGRQNNLTDETPANSEHRYGIGVIRYGIVVASMCYEGEVNGIHHP